MTLDDWSVSFLSASLSVLRRTLNPYTSARDCKMKWGGSLAFFHFLMANRDFKFQHHWGNYLTLPQARLCTCPDMYVSRGESISLSSCLTHSQKKKKEYASRGPWSLSTRDSGNARMVNLPNPHDADPLWYGNWLRGVVYHRAPLTSMLSYTPKLPITYLAHIRF